MPNKMFHTILVANRGVIACRIIRTLKRLGIRSVAVYSEADRYARHVTMADEAIQIGPAPATQSYLCAETILTAARQTEAQAIHPGYGFLSENAEFAEACETLGLAFIGPTPAQMRAFGLKHTARELAQNMGVPLLPGSDLLTDAGHALGEARRIGFPVMLKSTAGGGGIGMQLIWSEDQLTAAFETVERLARANFRNAGIYLEKYVESARHIEVQIFGDGAGKVVHLGERDCSVQRRNQKVIEETPAPNLTQAVRKMICETAVRLVQAVNYRNAGTVEFVYDTSNQEFYFLEVNTRLQVEHGVTEEVTGIDLVEWMVRQAAGDSPITNYVPMNIGHAIQVRIYAEDPGKSFQPSAGVLTDVRFSSACRVETWVEAGTEITPYYDPMIAKLIVKGDDRTQALTRMWQALRETSLYGIETNLRYLSQIITDKTFRTGKQTTRYLSSLSWQAATIDVIEPGVQTSLQDWPGRLGYWDVGVPPSGPMDALAHRCANHLLGNPEDAVTLELTMTGPTLRFNQTTTIALTGACMTATLNGAPLTFWQTHKVTAGSILCLGSIEGHGVRAYLAVAGGIDVPRYLGSRSTFTLGQFGGHAGRTLKSGDVLHLCVGNETISTVQVPEVIRPVYDSEWRLAVRYGPHGAPDFFTATDMETLFSTAWEVHYNSNRTGIRLIGPRPSWARTDGGDAGLHPSNIHDNAYAIGSVNFTGDMPILLGPDGPSLGGFVCPAVVVAADLWKLGQLRPGDTVRFVPIDDAEAVRLHEAQEMAIRYFAQPLDPTPIAATTLNSPIIVPASLRDTIQPIEVTYRVAGDQYLLVEYGPLILDLEFRFRVHALITWLRAHNVSGIIDLTPGVRSLQIHYDHRLLTLDHLMETLSIAERALPPADEMEMTTRIISLPMSWNDPTTQQAIDKYMTGVRNEAPWCPSNIEFIRRINGLDSVEEVRRIVFDASYLVLGLGDVYLGAPAATPLDPRHRLVTTKYNPARTWTAEGTVGIGGAYLCIYGMDSPGGYQLVGRTLPIWNRHKVTAEFSAEQPWLLRFFDQIRFFPVSANELLVLREDFLQGRYQLDIREEVFRLADYRRFLTENAGSISAFRQQQQKAFAAERERWLVSGQATYMNDDFIAESSIADEIDVPAHGRLIASHVAGNVWKVLVKPGQTVIAGEPLVILESMKMEIAITSPAHGTVEKLFCTEGSIVAAGQNIVVLIEQEVEKIE